MIERSKSKSDVILLIPLGPHTRKILFVDFIPNAYPEHKPTILSFHYSRGRLGDVFEKADETDLEDLITKIFSAEEFTFQD